MSFLPMKYKGLTNDQVAENKARFGSNTITTNRNNSLLTALWDQLKSVFVLLLIVAAVLSFVVGDVVEGCLIMGIVLVNAFFGLYQEHKAEEAVAYLQKMSVTMVRVMRNGNELEVPSTMLVPDDIVYIEEGSKVSADMVLLEAKNIEVNESILTGESLPVPKKKDETLFMGSLIAKGRGYAKVNTIGMSTKFGLIANDLSQVAKVKTPLEKKLTDISRFIGIAGIGISLLVFILSYAQGTPLQGSFLLAISLAVAIVPEGLPAVMAVTLGIGVKAMARQNAIVRRLSAIETMGSVTLIATDKTGTLTQNNMVVKEVYVDGDTHVHHNLGDNRTFQKMVLVGNLCSTASLVRSSKNAVSDMLGDPTEGALLVMSEDHGIPYEQMRQEWNVLDELAFDSETKRMSVLVQQEKHQFILTKGAPESVFDVSTHIYANGKKQTLSTQAKKDIELAMEEWAKKGHRVIGMCYKEVASTPKNLTDAVDDMVFLGLVALHDPPRPESEEAIKRARAAGVEVVMITGDNERTAAAIATQIGLLRKGEDIVTGEQVEQYSDQDLMKILPKTRIFARTTPQLKSRIVSLYQQLGEIVIVTGDGVNDAIALKQADVGIAMGKNGTDVARETADIVLADDNFATIVVALEEGRSIVRNLKNTLVYLLTGNASEGLSLVLGLFLGIHHLFLPIQLLYINLVSDGMPALALGFSPKDRRIMHEKPKKEIEVLERFDKRYIGAISVFNATLVVGSFFVFESYSSGLGRTAAFVILPLSQAFMFTSIWVGFRNVFRYLRPDGPMFWLGFLGPVIGQVVINSTPVTRSIFELKDLSIAGMVLLIFISSSSMIIFSLRQEIASRKGEKAVV